VSEVEELIVPVVAVIVAVPSPALVASPLLPTALLMTATSAFDDAHVTTVVRFCVLPSVYVPVAVYCCVVPSAIVGFCGLIAIDTSAAGVTTSVAVALTVPELIPIVVVPVSSELASPAVPTVLLIVATFPAVELQCPDCVRSCVLPSVYVPVAVYCCVVPSAIVAVAGLIAIDTSVAGVTVSVVDPLIVPDTAVIVAVPCPVLVASPGVAPPVLLIVATVGVSDDHAAVPVRFCVLPSVYVPVAVYCCVVPSAIDGAVGVTAIDTSAAAVTVTVVDPLIVPEVAVIVAVPSPTLVASPVVCPAMLIVATVGVSELHCTVPVMFCVLPSVYVPVAVNCCVSPSGSTGIAGVTAIDTSAAAVTVTVADPVIVPDVAEIVAVPCATLLATP